MSQIKIDIGPCAEPIRDQLIAQSRLSGKHRNSAAFDTVQTLAHKIWWGKVAGTLDEDLFYVLRGKVVTIALAIADELSLDTSQAN